MIRKASLLFNTVKYLKPIQVYYQLKYRIRKAGGLSSYNKTYTEAGVCFLEFDIQPPVYESYLGANKFSFLNLEVDFDSEVNWNYQENGKLWNYNLQYVNYLLQESVSVEEREMLLLSLYLSLDEGNLALEPYPVSLRSMNCIRFLSYHKVENKSLHSFLHAELDFLSKRPEYHLLGNHLLENAFALIMGGAYFSNQTWMDQGQGILVEQLDEQILKDGAHFELSPMYHQIIFFRLLELIDWYTKWESREEVFLEFLIDKAKLMRSWLSLISFESGDIPHFNDSANDIAYSTEWLLEYSNKLGIENKEIPLGESGYRSFKNENYECKVDVAQIGPSYQPGHAQADALSFILYYKNKPLFVEVGTSTYEINERRLLERSTVAHNTVEVNNKNQTMVWSGFRVAQRATTRIIEDRGDYLVGEHGGYKNIGNIHTRIFDFKDTSVNIIDDLKGEGNTSKKFHLHLHPDINIDKVAKESISLAGNIDLSFEGANNLEVKEYKMANGFNQYLVGKKIVVTFRHSLKTKISFKE